MSILPVTGCVIIFPSGAKSAARDPSGGRGGADRLRACHARSLLPLPLAAAPSCQSGPTHRPSVPARARRHAVRLPWPRPLGAAALLAPPAGGGCYFRSPSRRRAAAARLHARSRGRAAAAPQRALRPAPAPFGGDGRGGATRGGQYKTACRGGWPPPTQGRQRPVLLAHPTRPPYVLGCTSQRGTQRPSSSSKTRRIWPSPRRAACRLRLLNRTFPASSPAPLSAAATNAPHRHGKELGRYGRAGSPASRLVFRLLYLFSLCSRRAGLPVN